ncbi:MAG: hypothetical protein J3K34DRAFT_420743 [Monoraphidium minutum]|nr:MAG: hypothetical protein J3K34DRAFT_420743 [Monoraphidium minutum]
MLHVLNPHTAAAGSRLAAPSAAALARRLVRAMGHGSHTSDNDPAVLAKEKQRNLKGKTPEVVPGAPGWNQGLASESEAVVKAERAPEMPMEDMQRHTIEALGALDATQHDAEGGPAPGAHDPSGAPSIRENLEYDKTHPVVSGAGARP